MSLAQAAEVPGQRVLGLFFSRETTRAHHPPGPQEAHLFPWLSQSSLQVAHALLQQEQQFTQTAALLMVWLDWTVTVGSRIY